MVPTMKYEIVRVLFEFGLDMYGLKSGTPDGARKSAVAEWLRPPVVYGGVWLDVDAEVCIRRAWTEANDGAGRGQ